LEKPTILEIEATLGEKLPRCSVPGVEAYQELPPKPKTARRRRF